MIILKSKKPDRHDEEFNYVMRAVEAQLHGGDVGIDADEILMLRVRLAIAQGTIPHDKVVVRHEDGTETRFDRFGNADRWPKGLFSEDFELVRQIRVAQGQRYADDDPSPEGGIDGAI